MTFSDKNVDAPSKAFWFPVKSHGWGWGMPVKWQGWAVLAGYLGLQYLGIRHFTARNDVVALVIFLIVLTVVLIGIVRLKGERPLKWRWGRED